MDETASATRSIILPSVIKLFQIVIELQVRNELKLCIRGDNENVHVEKQICHCCM